MGNWCRGIELTGKQNLNQQKKQESFAMANMQVQLFWGGNF